MICFIVSTVGFAFIPIIMSEFGIELELGIELGLGKKNTSKKENIFPFQLSKIAKTLRDQYDKINNSTNSHVIEILWFLFIIIFFILFLFLSLIGIGCMIILSSYILVFFYKFRIPTTKETKDGIITAGEYGITKLSNVGKYGISKLSKRA